MTLTVAYHGGTRHDITSGKHRVVTDQPVEDGGQDVGMSPVELFVGSLASCVGYFVVNASKNYQNDGDSVWRLFYDTVKGGDFRAREANVHRLAELSVNIIDQCAAQGVPFAREYGGLLANRSFGGAQVSRTFYARGQTGQ